MSDINHLFSASKLGNIIATPNPLSTLPPPPFINEPVFGIGVFDTVEEIEPATFTPSTPSAPVNSVQFNNAGAFGGSGNLTWDGTNLRIDTPNLQLGQLAGSSGQSANAIALGASAGSTSQGTQSIAIGNGAGETSQGSGGIAIGTRAGRTNQPSNAIAIGNLAGDATLQLAESIILNASGASLGDGGVAGFIVNPVRELTGTGNRLYYNPTTQEISHSTVAAASSFKQVSFPGVYPPNPVGPNNSTNSCSFNGTTRVLLGSAPHAMSLQFTPGVDTGIWKIEARGSFLHNTPGGAAYLWFDNGTSPQDATGAAWSNLYENTLSIFYEATGGERGMVFTSYILKVAPSGPVQQVDWCFCSDGAGAGTELFFEGYVLNTGLLTMPNGLVPGTGATPIPNPPGGGPAVAGQVYRNYLNMTAVKIA